MVSWDRCGLKKMLDFCQQSLAMRMGSMIVYMDMGQYQ
jgi:hypothetical protein